MSPEDSATRLVAGAAVRPDPGLARHTGLTPAPSG